jgi:hypothetical protein
MPLSSTDIIQSFRLRFWRESHQASVEAWRGDVWHEQQMPGEEAVVVAGPEEAFELVRRTLQRFSQKAADADRLGERAGENWSNRAAEEERQSQPTKQAPRLPAPRLPAPRLLSLWRILRRDAS